MNGQRRCVIYIDNGILAIKKNDFSSICNNMDGPRGYYAYWNKTEKRQIQYDITYMWNLKTKTNEYNKIETDSQI